MANEKLKKLIDEILDERRDRVFETMDVITNNIIIQLEKLKELEDFHTYTIPADFALEEKRKEGSPIDILYNYIKNISLSANQLDLINNLLDGINHFSSRAALFLLREDKLVGWKGKGFSGETGSINDEEVKKIFISLSANTIFKYVLEKQVPYAGVPHYQPDDHLIYSRFGGEIPKKIYVLPFFVKGKPQAIVYSDNMGNKIIGEKEIEMISLVGEMSLDLLPLRQKILAKVKTQEYVETPETPPARTRAPEQDERTVTTIKENDPERLARVIVNDIYLYNKPKVEEIIRTGQNLFEALQNTIMQSRELYLNKFTDLGPFERQLIITLARGKKELLRGYHFETL